MEEFNSAEFRKRLELDFKEMEDYVQRISGLLNEKKGNSEMMNFLIKNSLFTTVWAFIEHSLRTYAELRTACDPKLQKKVLKLEKMHQLHSFLHNELSVDVQKAGEEWGKLDVFRELRNCLIHYHGTVRNTSRKTLLFIKEDDRLVYNEEENIFQIKDAGIIEELMETGRRFLLAIAK
ncbi:MAG: hypothetical protein ACK4ND_12580 [Cytophagaceae bacterium]